MCVGVVMKVLTMMQTSSLEKFNYVNMLTRNLLCEWNKHVELFKYHLEISSLNKGCKDISHNIMCKFIVICAFQKVDA
jgi:hypothetical protein